MMQAKKKKPAKSRSRSRSSSPRSLFSIAALWVFLGGLVIGSLATLLIQGAIQPTTDIGVGIRSMIQESRDSALRNQQVNESIKGNADETLQTNYDFFTVLPEVEVVVADDEQAEQNSTSNVASQPSPKEETAEKEQDSASAYMLQAGSYKSEADARNLKVNLALSGLRAEVQKVTIQGRGDFYRVRLGPFTSYNEMESTNSKLASQGIKALRLKVSN